ncbi:hypothetical protein QVD17_00692 [Tagetes erecta]|uniref:Uncharacterized protein n=1 Tax=Tagetes erecta TaxID=13708 RepID=A0AAD8LAP4_TARER|nr:hypothetical protein QVD17_00692 [Tagetes erecta]
MECFVLHVSVHECCNFVCCDCSDRCGLAVFETVVVEKGKGGFDDCGSTSVCVNQVFSLVDFICCCAVIVLIVWSLFAKTDVQVGISMSLFRVFGVVVIVYLFSLRIGVFPVKITAGYKHQWVCNAVDEIGSLVLYLVMFYMFRPVLEEEMYSVVVDDDKGVYVEAPDMVKG